ncbi:MAG TPA: hypothetical protein ENF26_03315 [Methanomicrobia archaeon]|nr:hypothetical protein [Methanomicrobia archaeon]HEX59160.1 hypothetical protein [Methanomicrobia archaeon]
MMSYLADRLIQFYEDFDGFCEWIKRMEAAGALKKVEIDKEQQMVVMRGKVGGPSGEGIGCGISRKSIDPINNLVLLGFAFFGQYWAMMPDAEQAFKKVKKWWRRKLKEGVLS